MLVGLRDGEDKGQMLELGSTKASIALKKMQPEAEEWEDPLAAAFQSGFCIFEAEMPEPEWYELSCDEGRYVIALEPEEAGNGTCAIPVKLIRQDMTDEDLPEYGVLEAMREADETLRIVGYRRFDRTPQPTVPLNNDSLDGAKMILIGNVLTEEGESEVELGGPIRLTEEEGRGLSISRKPIAQICELDADRVLATGEVCDIYFHEYDITGKMR